MPTNNPRLTITLEPSLAALLRRLSELTGNSQSKLIAEILQGSEQVFERLIRVLEAAETAKAQLKEVTVRDMESAQNRIEQQLGLALGEMDSAFAPILKEAEAITRRSARRTQGGPASRGVPAAAGPKATPPSNRGVRSTNPKTKVNKTTTTRGKRNGPL